VLRYPPRFSAPPAFGPAVRAKRTCSRSHTLVAERAKGRLQMASAQPGSLKIALSREEARPDWCEVRI
jgi:hypothetical protein